MPGGKTFWTKGCLRPAVQQELTRSQNLIGLNMKRPLPETSEVFLRPAV